MITFKEYLIEKPLTPQQRIKRARVMKRLAPKIKMKRKIAMKKKASLDTIKKRAEKKAKDIVRQKFSKDKYNTLSYAEKIQVDKKVELKKGLIKKIAKKLIPQMKRAEAERLKQLKNKSEATVSLKKENNGI